MKVIGMHFFKLSAVFGLVVSATICSAANVTGTVTNKTTGKPSAGDSVALVDVQAGMSDAATAVTDAQGRYALRAPGAGPYLVRVTHQGAPYFIAAPMGAGPGDVGVYDVAAKLDGVGIDADMLLIEAQNGTLHVQERYLVHNTSNPPRAQFSANTFEIVIPPSAEMEGGSATRPGGMSTIVHLAPLPGKGHYAFGIPIQPNQGEKETMFEVQYHLPYNGKLTISPQLMMHADNVVIYLPKSMTFQAGEDTSFQPSPENPMLQTFIQKNVQPGQKLGFTVQGEGEIPRQLQGGDMGAAAAGGGMGAPGGGIGVPINTPDPLTKYKGWILGILALALVAAAAILLRRKASDRAVAADSTTEGLLEPPTHVGSSISNPSASLPTRTASVPVVQGRNATLLDLLKEELFAIETEKLTGDLSIEQYEELKAGIQALLKRTLARK